MSHGRFNNPVQATLAGVKDLFRKQALTQYFDPNNRIDDKVCLVTGANTGLGFAIACQLAERGGHVLMACRSGIPEAGEKIRASTGSDKVEMLSIDLSDSHNIHRFCDKLSKRGIKLDIVVLNAGVTPPKARQTSEGLDEMFMVNYVANFILMNRLLADGILPNQRYAKRPLPEGVTRPRVLFISSDSHQKASAIDYEEFGTYHDYGVRKSINNYSYFKLILNTFAVELHRRLNPSDSDIDVAINVMCPGPVNTDIARDAPPLLKGFIKFMFFLFFRSPKKAAMPVTYLSCSPRIEGKSNIYLHMFNPKRMDTKVYDATEGERLWKVTERLAVKLAPDWSFRGE